MAPTKPAILDQKNSKPNFQYLKKGSGLQSRRGILNNQNMQDYSKRKANFSPKKDDQTKKPLIDMTNDAASRKENMAGRNVGNIGTHLKRTMNLKCEVENIAPGTMTLRSRTKQAIQAQPKPLPRGPKFAPNPREKLPQPYATKSVPQLSCSKVFEEKNAKPAPGSAPSVIPEQKTDGRVSLESSKSEENLLYLTALEDCLSDTNVSDSTTLKASSEESSAAEFSSSCSENSNVTVIHRPSSVVESSSSCLGKAKEVNSILPPSIVESSSSCLGKANEVNSIVPPSIVESSSSCLGRADEINSHLPPGVEDFDAETWDDPFLASCYAMDIFTYLKSREVLFPVDGSYLERQKGLSMWMRSLLVDWMVEIQETFELNHETLYLAVKIVDLFLSRHKSLIRKENLQLVGTTALFLASKYDERTPPTLEDFKYLCDEAYTKEELINMESTILKVLDFNLGISLSYRFLRRYARCYRASIDVLTLARFILEMSLMDYSLISYSDSKMAAAALLLAIKMKKLGGWTPTLEYYSGYSADDIRDLTHELNAMIHKKPRDGLMTVRNKYSHKVFHEVATIPLIHDLQL